MHKCSVLLALLSLAHATATPTICVLHTSTLQLSARLSDIQALQEANHPSSLKATEAASEGFVTLRHSLEWLHELLRLAPQVVALSEDDSVVGYTLTVSPSGVRAANEELAGIYEPFFSMIERLEWDGALLHESRWVLGGQCCVAKGWRRQGLMRRLYETQALALAEAGAASAVVTAVDLANVPSVRAHEAAGFVEISRYGYSERPTEHSRDANDGLGGWSIVLRPI